MNNLPSVSILIPTLNSESTIEKCLQSAFSQTYKNVEVFVCDGGSNDKTVSIIRNKFPSVHLLLTDKGVSRQRNKMIDETHSDFVFFLDSDDYLDENTIEILMRQQTKNNADIVAPSYIYFNETKETKKIINCVETFDLYNFLELSDNSKFYLAPHKLYSKSYIGDTRFLEDVAYGEDTIFNLSLAEKCGKYVGCDNCFYHFYHQPKSYIKKYNLKRRLKIYSILFCKRKLFKGDKKIYARYNNWLYSKIVEFINFLIRNRKIFGLLCILKIRYFLVFKKLNNSKIILIFPLFYALFRKIFK